ncbi:hypothetical protein MRX96_021871 [Rhipicephalus microplus]
MRKFSRRPRKIFTIDTSPSNFAAKQKRLAGREDNEDGLVDVFQQLRPLLFSLRLLGLYSGKDSSGPSAFSFLKTTIALTSSQALIRKESQVCRLARRLAEIPPATAVSLRTTATIMAACVWTFVLLSTFVECAVLIAYTPQELSEHAASSWFGVDSQLPADVLLPLCIVDRVLSSVLENGCLFFSMALYLSFAVALRHRYVAFNAVIERHVLRGTFLDAKELRQLMMARTELYSVVRKLDRHFSPSAFLWVTLFVLGVGVEVSHFLGHRRTGHRYELVIFAPLTCTHLIQVVSAQNLGSVTLAFLLLSVLASRLTEAAHASPASLYRCLGHAKAATTSLTRGGSSSVGSTTQWPSTQDAVTAGSNPAGSPSPASFLEGRILASMLTAPAVELTGWGFFSFSRSFVLTLAGALISYVVIIVQLNPAASGGGKTDH